MVLRKGAGVIMSSKSAQWCVVFSTALICAQMVVAQTAGSAPATGAASQQPAADATVLTHAQWLKRVGEAAKDPGIIKDLMKQIAAGERVEFTQRVLKAITRMPLSPEEKQVQLTKAAIACIGGTPLQNDERYKVIAEIVAAVPVEFLPGVVDALSKRFSPKLNGLTTEQYKGMAETTTKLAVDRNKSTDDPAVRTTFAILLFLNATTPEETPDLQAMLMALLPDDKSRELAKGWIDEALKGNYEPMLTAADAAIRVTPPMPVLQRVGVSQIEQLLVEAGGLTGSFGDIRRGNVADSGAIGMGLFAPSDVGIQTVPKEQPIVCPCPCPYPNQLDLLP
jgi:hypothetical protein